MRKSSIPLRADSRKDDRGRSGKDYLIVGIILFLYLLLALLVFDPRLHTGGDNAHYICLARSILSGKGYREIYKPGEPPHTLYPFGYPLLLAPVISLFKSSFVALKILSLLFGACSVLLVYMLLENRCGRLCLYAVVGLFAVSPLLLEYSHYVLSDSSFTFFSLLSLFLFRRAELDLRRFPPLLWASVVCAVFTYYIRPIGASLFLGVLLYFVVRKQLKKVMFALAIVVILVLPWSVRNARVPGGSGYFAPFILKNPYDLESGTISTKDFRQRLKSNSEAYLLINFPKTVFSMHKKLWPGAKRRWDMYSFGVLLSGVMLLGFIRELRQRLELPHYYVILYTGTLLIWPQVWATDRFVLPVAPFALFYFLSGGLLLTHRLDAESRKRVGLFVTMLLMLSSLLLVAQSMPHSLKVMQAYARGNRTAGYPPEWVNYYETAAYASKFTAKDAAFMARKPALFYLFANRKCLVYPFTSDQEKVMDTIRENGVSYVIVDAFTWTRTTRRYLVPAILAHQNDFQVVYATRPPKTLVLAYTGE